MRKFRGQGNVLGDSSLWMVAGGKPAVASSRSLAGASRRGARRDGGPLAGKLLRESDGPVLLSRRGVGRVGEGSDGAQASEVSGLVVRLAGEHGIHDLSLIHI